MTRRPLLECAKCGTVEEKATLGLPVGWGTLVKKVGSSVQTFRDLCPSCLAPVEAMVG